MSVTFNWELHEIAGVGHDPQLMANDALQYFLPSFLSVDSVKYKSSIKLYPNPTNLGLVTIESSKNEQISIRVFDMLGKQVKKEILKSNLLNVLDLNPGLYIIQITQNGFFTTKNLMIN